MPYCSKQDLIDRFGEQELIDLTDRVGTGAIDEQVLAQAMSDASAEMDAYIGSRYTLPLATVPNSIKTFACNIARYYLYDEQASEQVTKRYEASMMFLKKVASGEVSLGATDDGSKAASADLPEIESAGSVFSRESAKGFI